VGKPTYGATDGIVDSFQISPQQERIWTSEPEGPAARNQVLLAIDGAVEDPNAVTSALRNAVERHESLRTTFVRQPGLTFPLQAVNAQLEPRIETVDVPARGAAARAQQLERVLDAEMQAPFDLEQGPLLSAVVLAEGGKTVALILTLSALCADTFSTSLLAGEVASRLAGGGGEEDPLQYADFSAWQHELSESDDDEARTARAFWGETGSSPAPTLPFRRSGRSDVAVLESLELELDDSLAQALSLRAGDYGTTPAAFVQSAWHAVLGRYAAAESTTVAFVAGERRHADLEGAIGAFARPVPIQAPVQDGRSFAEVLSELTAARAQALVLQDYAPVGPLDGVDVGFVEYPLTTVQADSVEAHVHAVRSNDASLRLVAGCGSDDTGRLRLSVAFDPVRYDRQIVTGLGHALVRMLEAASANPSVPLGDVDFLGEQEREQVLYAFNHDTAATPAGECVHTLFASHVASAPERTAVQDASGSISYAQLNMRANQLAHRLRQAGAGPGGAVGLCTDRSIEMVVGLLGILKAGAAYVPLHHEHPPARLAHQLRQAGACALVTQQALLDRVDRFDGEVLCLDRDRSELDGEPVEEPASSVSPDDRAYVIYTSGSTGTPKGVEISHASLANYASYIVERLQARQEPLSFALATSISTDLGNTSVFGALCSGGTLVLIDPAAAADPGAMAEAMQANAVDVLKITPSHIGALLAAGDARVLPRRWLVVGGELAGWDLVARVRELSGCAILNHYGPTETTIGCCTYLVQDGPGEYQPAGVPIGAPITNTACYVLDERRRPVPIGVAGRLFVSGAGVARGYTGDPQLTDDRFGADSFAQRDGVRMYDTGDMVRWLPDGNLEFLGRADEQLKLRGYRVEPAEVEAALRSHAQVREAVVAIQTSATGEPRLIAYCVGQGPIEREQLRSHLTEWLPEYMMPGAIVVLAELPRTPSGKIDKLSLPDPDLADAQNTEYIAPRTPLEEAVATIWKQVLGVEQVGAQDDFFALGGHSLLATQVVARVRSDFAVDLPLHSLFTYPTVASLAAEMVNMMGASETDETDKLMAELEGMSDEEAQRLLTHDLSSDSGRT
jgi:amino acid adenylation domain-containing protein